MALWTPAHRVLLCAGLAALLYLPGLGRPPLWEPDEGRYAEVAREMLVGHDYVTPHNNFIRYLEKPPLVYWATAVSIKTFGRNEFAVRFQAAAASAGQVAITEALAEMMFGASAGLLAALALALSPLFLGFAQFATPDPALALFLTGAMGCFYVAAQAPGFGGWRSRVWMLGAVVLLALGTLVKGPVALVLGGPIALLWLMAEGRVRDAVRLPWLGCIAVYAAIVAPWFILVAGRNPGFLRFFFLHEHVQRYLQNTEHAWGPWFFIPIIIVGTWPWLYFVPLAFSRIPAHFLSTGIASRASTRPCVGRDADHPTPAIGTDADFANGTETGSPAPSLGAHHADSTGSKRPERAATDFLLIWIGVILIFFSIPKSKLGEYILPAIPPIAILGGLGLLRLGDFPVALRRRLLLILVAINAAAAIGAAIAILAANGGRLTAIVAVDAIVIAAALVTGAIAAFIFAGKRRPIAGVGLSFAASMLFAMAAGIDARERVAPLVSYRSLAAAIAPFTNAGCRLASYRHFEQALPFYTGVPEILVNYSGELQPFARPTERHGAIFATAAELNKTWASKQCVVLVANRVDLPALANWLSPEPKLAGCEGKKTALYNCSILEPPPAAAGCIGGN